MVIRGIDPGVVWAAKRFCYNEKMHMPEAEDYGGSIWIGERSCIERMVAHTAVAEVLRDPISSLHGLS